MNTPTGMDFISITMESGQFWRYRKSIFLGPGYIKKYELTSTDEMCLDELSYVSIPYQCYRNDFPVKFVYDMFFSKNKNKLVEIEEEKEKKEKEEDENEEKEDKKEDEEDEKYKKNKKKNKKNKKEDEENNKEDAKEKVEKKQELTESQKKNIMNLQLQYDEVIVENGIAWCTNNKMIIKKEGNNTTIVGKRTTFMPI